MPSTQPFAYSIPDRYTSRGRSSGPCGHGGEYYADEACNVPIDCTREMRLAKLNLMAQDDSELDPTGVLIAPRDAVQKAKITWA